MACRNDLPEISRNTELALAALLGEAKLAPGQILVVGCSSSEILGEKIGSCTNGEVGQAVYRGLMPLVEAGQLFLAVQCCEHLNRCLVVERACAEKYGWEAVNVVPQLNAGGALATAAYERMQSPVVVETIRGHAGMDIGDTFIGMHLRPVAVPVRCQIKTIGQANLTMARTRPKMVGGARAVYQPES